MAVPALTKKDPLECHPVFRKRSEEAAVFSFHADGFPGAGFRMGPAGAVGVGEDALSDDGGVGAVGAVKSDASPVDKLVSGIDGGKAHRIVIVNGPRASFRNAAESRVEANGEPFLGNVDLRIERAGLDLVGPEEMVSEVHQLVGWWSFFGFLFFKLRHATRKIARGSRRRSC